MNEPDDSPRYDLQERTLTFAKHVRQFVKQLAMTPSNQEDSRQLIRASGPVGANYIEANEALSKKDFLFRMKICRKEAKESRYRLELLDTGTEESHQQRAALLQEAGELLKIFSSIVHKAQHKE